MMLGGIAQTLVDKREIDSARALQEERLSVVRAMGDLDGIGVIQLDLADMDIQLENYAGATERLSEAWQVFSYIGSIDYLAAVGDLLGQLYIHFEQYDKALPILEQAQQAMLTLGQVDEASRLQSLIDECNSGQSR